MLAAMTAGMTSCGKGSVSSQASQTPSSANLSADSAPDAGRREAKYAFEDSNTYWEPEEPGTSVLEHKFEQETEFNTISFEEKGRKIDEVKVEARIGGEYQELYRQDEMGTRAAVVESTKTNQVRVTVKTTEKGAGIRLINFENRQPVKRKQPFRVTSYMVGPMSDRTRACFDKLDVITDIILIGYCSWDEAGNLIFGENMETKLEQDAAELKKAIGTRDINIWFCIGGASASAREDQTKIFHTSEKREKLAGQCLKLVAQYDFVGIDIDYEYPNGPSDWRNFEQFIIVLKSRLAAAGKRLSCAMAPWGVTLTSDGLRAIDEVQIMAYDLFDEKRRHATYEKAADAISYFTGLGFCPEQLNLGLAVYGRRMDDEKENWPSYDAVIAWYGEQIDDFTNSFDGSYFTGKAMNRDKTYLAVKCGLGGVMTWHFACDIPLSDRRSIHRSIRETVDAFVELDKNSPAE